jgi:hypothetical protein
MITIAVWLTGLMLFTFWFNYIMGSPLAKNVDNANTSEILAWIPLALADRRLRRAGLYGPIKAAYLDELNLENHPKGRLDALADFRHHRLDMGRRFFTWEKSLLCPICMHWWLTILFGAVTLTFDLLHARELYLWAGFIYLVTHFIIRKIV